jgi:hypothetical protein
MKTKVTFFTQLCIAAILLSVLVPGYAEANETLWIEGEHYITSSWNNHSWYRRTNISMDLLSPGKPGVSNGDWHVHFTDNDHSDSPSTSLKPAAICGGFGSIRFAIKVAAQTTATGSNPHAESMVSGKTWTYLKPGTI